MQKLATRVFVYASVVFGVVGILMVLTIPNNNQTSSDLHIALTKLLFADGFVVLSSFALSVAGKYLNGKA